MIHDIREIELLQMITIDRLFHCPPSMEDMYHNRMKMLKNMRTESEKHGCPNKTISKPLDAVRDYWFSIRIDNMHLVTNDNMGRHHLTAQ